MRCTTARRPTGFQLLVAAALTLGLLLATGVSASAAPKGGSANRLVDLDARLSCVAGGGADVTFTVRNYSFASVEIDPDFHLMLIARGTRGQPIGAGVVAFVFPAPSHKTIPPGESRTFLIGMGTSLEGEPGVDLSGTRLSLSAEVWLAGFERPTTEHFDFPACN